MNSRCPLYCTVLQISELHIRIGEPSEIQSCYLEFNTWYCIKGCEISGSATPFIHSGIYLGFKTEICIALHLQMAPYLIRIGGPKVVTEFQRTDGRNVKLRSRLYCALYSGITQSDNLDR